MPLPKNTEITVILQGPIVPQITSNAIEAAKRVLPGAFIFVSTWKNENLSDISCDKIIANTPPPSIIVHNNCINNTNRLIFGTQQALSDVRTKYTLKLRTDIILQDSSFLQYWDVYNQRKKQFQVFRHRVLNYYLFAPQFNYRQGMKIPTLFHPSDWMFFGLTSDIKRLFNIPLQPDPSYSLWWAQNVKPTQQIDCWPEAVFRYAPEQYLFYQAIHKRFPSITFNSYLDITRKKEELSRFIMVNNFVILDYRQWHIKLPKYQHLIGTLPFGQTSHVHWQIDYKKYCAPSFKISWKNTCFKYIKLNLGEILKTKKIELEKWFVTTFFLSWYQKHLYKKYAQSPAKLEQKLNALSAHKPTFIYTEDIRK